MSIIHLNSHIIDTIANQTGMVMANNLPKLPIMPDRAPPGVADEAFGLLLPPALEEQIRTALPGWATIESSAIHIGIKTEAPAMYYYDRHLVFAEFDKPHINLPGHGVLTNIPGAEQVEWDGMCMTFTPATDGSRIEAPKVREFIEHMVDLDMSWRSYAAKTKKATEDMRLYLSKFRTLQQAVKDFGPAIWEFIPRQIKQQYDRVPEKRARRPKPEVPDVDIKYLIATATANKLQLNA